MFGYIWRVARVPGNGNSSNGGIFLSTVLLLMFRDRDICVDLGRDTTRPHLDSWVATWLYCLRGKNVITMRTLQLLQRIPPCQGGDEEISIFQLELTGPGSFSASLFNQFRFL